MADAGFERRTSGDVFSDAGDGAVPIFLVRTAQQLDRLASLTDVQRAWIKACDFVPSKRRLLMLPDAQGRLATVLFGVGEGLNGQPCGPSEYLLGDLATKLPAGRYRLGDGVEDSTAAATAWGLGAYSFPTYKSQSRHTQRSLALDGDVDAARVRAVTDAVWLGRDLINTPSSDLGPDQLEAAARLVAERHGATCSAIVGDQLLVENFPLIHAVGRASVRQPRLVDITWGRADAPRITLVGKGICFDTGGLDLKPASAMLLMKKDMGGAATALALADMIMALGLDVRLRLLLAVAENSVSGNAFRPGDVLSTRAGYQVEIGNTDAEGRLVLADALTLADEDKPDLVATFATLTGAARVALGPDLPAMFSTDQGVADQIMRAGNRVADPVWAMPFWQGYDKNLEHGVADFNNVSEGPFGGSITAALFLKRFVRDAQTYVHFDLYGWRQATRPLGPKGGEPHVARTMLEVIESIASAPTHDGGS
ncbi:MAG: leucyl aminopeptidase family protein [Hyphomicrobiaceae bacterium]